MASPHAKMPSTLSSVLLFLVLATVLSVPAYAQEAAGPAEAEQKTALSVDDADKLAAMVVELDSNRSLAADLDSRVEGSDDASKPVIQLRLARTWVDLLAGGNQFAEAVLDLADAGARASPYWDQAIAELIAHPDLARFANRELKKYIVVPPRDQSAAEQAAAYSRLFQLFELQHGLMDLIVESISLSRQFDIDVSEAEQFLRNGLADRAAALSVLLELASSDVKARQAGLEVVPGDAELTAQLAMATRRVNGLAAALQKAVAMMDKLEMETAAYRQQIIGSTGEISADTFNLEVLLGLLGDWGEQFTDSLVEDGPNLLMNLLLFVVIILVSRRLAKFAQKLVEKMLDRSELDLSVLLRNMALSLVRNVVLILGILIALSQIGISLGPVLAGLGVAGFVIGFALQDTLSNFASGLMILIYRPFDTGDAVEAGGVSGTVSHMSLVSTTILTFDNQTIVVPNNMIWGGVIKNVTAQRTRRVDLIFSISYDDDIDQAETVLREIIEADKRVLKHPETTIRLHELADSSVNFIVRPWVKTADYWAVYWDTLRAVKMRFDEKGIRIPYPQQELHLSVDGPVPIESNPSSQKD